jgi:hypothetical protein
MAAITASKMTNLLPDTHPSTPQQNSIRIGARSYSPARFAAQFSAVVLVLFIYSYPALKTRADFGPASLPPMFAPDLSLYLNLSSLRPVSPGQVLNPYYLVPVPSNGTAYLKFRMGAALFGSWSKLLAGRMWLAMFLWNLCWWALLCALALRLFERFLPLNSLAIGIAGLGLLMLVNTGMAKPLLAAWIHLPSLSGFQSVGMPFMRAFSPQIPIPLLLAYLGLQMGALRGKNLSRWFGMGVLQLLALSTFPYATLMMAGLTFVSVSWQLFSRSPRNSWQVPLVYGAACAIADAAFLMRGSLNIYASHSSPIHFQPQLLPHLVGGAWLLLCLLAVATLLSKTLPAEVKWPLVGLGATNSLLMLGDAVVPSTVLLLSSHAAYFAHTTIAVLFTFLVSAALLRMQRRSAPSTPSTSTKMRIAVGVVLAVLALNGIFLALGTYRTFLPANREQAQVARLLSSLPPAPGDLVIARSLTVDDACGWVALLSRGPVLFCTDAETMLTPQQNHDVHRFRQALYLYFSGKDTAYLQRILTDPHPSGPMYQLGFWAEATSFSPEEQQEGFRGIQTDLMPILERVQSHDAAATNFFRQFQRIIVIDNLQDPTFVPARLNSFLKLEGEQHLGNGVLFSYVPQKLETGN